MLFIFNFTKNLKLIYMFSYSITKKDTIHILVLEGELIDKNQANEFIHEVSKIIISNHNKFVIDLSNLKYLNSNGLTILIQTLTKARKSGGEVVIAHVSNRVNDLFIITKLNTVFTITGTVDDGIAILNKLSD
ncbi:MAG: STAS domain-containing protein [Bacteroidota bacterium]